MVGFSIALIILITFMYQWQQTRQAHEKRIQQLQWRIHVNGIRGKSTVTRLIAGVLREGGYRTVAKTTGSAARIIHADGTESPIHRQGAPTILEQINIIEKHVTPETEALVMECMAVNPLYQHVSQHQIVKGNITVITNVREDHQDVMGDSLPEIADSLANTTPYEGLLITAESRPELQNRLAQDAAEKGAGFLYADANSVTDEDLQAFNYLAFKENLAIGFAIAQILGIPRDVALRGMQRAMPDIGAVFVERIPLHGKELVWAPLFAVNDRESMVLSVEALKQHHQPNATRIGILNNRLDRAVRALKFADIAALDLNLDYYITFGMYETQVTEQMVAQGYPRERIIHLGASKNPTEVEILQQVTDLIEGEQGVLIGMVNIHTPQAELLMAYFEQLRRDHTTDNMLLADLDHLSSVAQRQRYLAGHLLPAVKGGKNDLFFA